MKRKLANSSALRSVTYIALSVHPGRHQNPPRTSNASCSSWALILLLNFLPAISSLAAGVIFPDALTEGGGEVLVGSRRAPKDEDEDEDGASGLIVVAEQLERLLLLEAARSPSTTASIVACT